MSDVKLLNKKAVREYCLNKVKYVRPGHEFTQVSAEFIRHLELDLENVIDRKLKQLPSVGKTIA